MSSTTAHLATLLVTTTLVAGGSATAATATTAVGAHSPAAAPKGTASRGSYGSTSENGGVLRHGCHQYRWHYEITTPTRTWLAEVQLKNPNHVNTASKTLLAESDSNVGHRFWTICRSSTVVGRYTLRMKVTWEHADGSSTVRFARDTHFWLTRHRR